MKKISYIMSICSIVYSFNASAGIPVLDEASSIWMPIQYIEQINTQLNTLNQYEQMIKDYENQYRQLEGLIQNTNFANIKLENLSDLRNSLNIASSQYRSFVNAYNNFAENTNALIDAGCDLNQESTVCASLFQESLDNLKATAEYTQEQLKETMDPAVDGSTANILQKDTEAFNSYLSSKNRQQEGTNQILADNRVQSELLNKQMLEQRNTTNKLLAEELLKKQKAQQKEITHKKYTNNNILVKRIKSTKNEVL